MRLPTPDTRLTFTIATIIVLLAVAAAYFAATPTHPFESWLLIAAGLATAVSVGWLQIYRLRRQREREKLLTAIFEAVPHILFFKDRESRYREVNKVFETTFSTSIDSLRGKTDRELFGPELYARFVDQDREVMRSGQPATFHELISVGGEVRHIEARKQPMIGDDGRSLGIVGLAIDVTASRQMQEQLEERGARLRVALSAARMGTWTWDVSKDLITIDPACASLLGVEGPQCSPRAIYARMLALDVTTVKRSLRHALEGGNPVDFEFRLIDGSGRVTQWVESNAMLHETPDGSGYLIGVTREITERKEREIELSQAQHELEEAMLQAIESRESLALALDVGDLGVWHSEYTWGADDAVSDDSALSAPVHANAAALRMLGWDANESLTRRDARDAIHPEDYPQLRAAIDEAFEVRGARVYSGHFRAVRPDGEIRNVAIRASSTWRLNLQTGQSTQITAGVLRDTTDDDATKEQLAKAALEANQATLAKGRFLAMMSHEIRTPMTGFIGMIDLLANTRLDAEQQHMIRVCRASARSLQELLNDILDFSKIEERKLLLDVRPFPLWDVLEAAVEGLGSTASVRGIALHLEIDPMLPEYVLGDALRVRQVLTNLVNNAIKFTEVGCVRVRAYRELRGSEVSWVCVEVTDSGIGMNAETVEGLFEPFVQADLSTTRRFGGSGLGLSIVRNLVTLMGGTVGCDSELGRGSRFAVELPLQAVDRSSIDPLPLSAIHVLIWSNRPDRRWLWKDALPRLGADTHVVDDQQAFLTQLGLLTGRPSSVVVLDAPWAQIPEQVQHRLLSGPDSRGAHLVVGGSRAETPGTITILSDVPLTRTSVVGALLSVFRSPLPEGLDGQDIHRHLGGGRQVLVADDSSIVRDVLTVLLQKLGFVCHSVESGEQAWEAYLAQGKHPFAALITDCQMPGMSGYELVQRIRREERDRGLLRLPILALTAGAMENERQLCLDAGMDGYLAKPIALDELASCLSDLINVGAASDGWALVESLNGFDVLKDVFYAEPQQLEEVLMAFIDSISIDMQALSAAISSGDVKSCAQLAHTIRMACEQVGDRRMSTAFGALEQALLVASIEDLPPLFADGKKHWQDCVARVQKGLRQGRHHPAFDGPDASG